MICTIEISRFCNPYEKHLLGSAETKNYAEKIVRAIEIANIDIYRAVTHNKGIIHAKPLPNSSTFNFCFFRYSLVMRLFSFGMDLGYRVNQKLKLYSNIGYTYRIPTYTDLFYSSPTTLGNENLKLEKALTKEFGLKYLKNNFNLRMSLYQRDASDIIDYVKNNETEPWQASNIREIITNGFELSMGYKFYLGAFRPQSINIGYSNINDDLLESDFAFSRYALNSLKNQITATYMFQVRDFISSTISFKNSKRLNDKGYTLIDFRTSYIYDKFTISVILNNILDTEYSETNLVPMPGFNSLVGIKYSN